MDLFDEFDIRSLFMVDGGEGRSFMGESSKRRTDQKRYQYYGKTKVHNNGVNSIELITIGESEKEIIGRLSEMALFGLDYFIFAITNERSFLINADVSCSLN